MKFMLLIVWTSGLWTSALLVIGSVNALPSNQKFFVMFTLGVTYSSFYSLLSLSGIALVQICFFTKL